MGLHHRAHVERLELLEQPAPDNGDQARRGDDLREVDQPRRHFAARGEVPAGLVDLPQIIAAPGLVAIIWSGLFEKFEPLDVRAMMKTHVALLFAPRRAA